MIETVNMYSFRRDLGNSMSDPTFVPRLAGDWQDDDPQVIDALFEQAADPPDIGATAVVESAKPPLPKRLTTLLTGYVTIDSNTSGSPIQLLPGDPRRKNLAVRVLGSPLTTIYLSDDPGRLAMRQTSGFAYAIPGGGDVFLGDYTGPVYALCTPIVAGVTGWVTLIPRQTINGATTVQGDIFDIGGANSVRLVRRIYSVAGTTPTITASLLGVTPDGTLIGGTVITSLTAGTAAGLTTGMLNSPTIDDVRGFLNTGGASGDSVIDVELLAYVERTGTTSSVIVSWAAVTE